MTRTPRTVRTAVFLALACLIVPTLDAASPFTAGWYLRLRHEYWKNAKDFEDSNRDDQNFFRIKTAVWGQWDPSPKLSLYVRLANENRIWLLNEKANAGYNINELLFDNLYVDVRNVFGAPVDLRLGRQEFPLSQYGEGFLIADATMIDGSRTFYFDAAKASWRMAPKTTLDAFYIQSSRFDDFLPVINPLNGTGQQLNYSNERGWALWHKTDAVPALHLETYYMGKREFKEAPTKSAPFAPLLSQDSEINTVGSFAKYDFSKVWSAKGQAACQWGTYGRNDRRGLGGYLFNEFLFRDRPLAPLFGFGAAYLSGDDKTTKTVEAWDPLFNMSTFYAESYYLSYMYESAGGYWTNLTLYRAYLSGSLSKKARLNFYYNQLYANESVSGSIFGAGKYRGTVYHARLVYTFSPNVNAYLNAEYFTPGSFYRSGTEPSMQYRSHLEMKF